MKRFLRILTLCAVSLFAFESHGQDHIVYDFATDGDTEGWEAHENCTVAADGGSLLMTSTDAGNGWTGIKIPALNIDQSIYTQITIVIKNGSDLTKMQIVNFDQGSTAANVAQKFTLQPLSTGDTEYQTYTFDTPINADHADNMIDLFMIRPQGAIQSAGVVVEFESITFVSNNASSGAQTITFEPLSAVVVGDPAFDLTATASSQLAVTYASSDPSVASISGNTVTIVAEGTTDITASQAGDESFDAAADVVQTLTVNSASAQTITFDPLTPVTVGDPNFDLNATASSNLAVSYTSSDPLVATISGSTVTILAAGTTDITASQAGDGSFDAAADVVQPLLVKEAGSEKPHVVFDFDTDVEGWRSLHTANNGTVNEVVTAADGSLVCTSAIDGQWQGVISPVGLGLDATIYDQVMIVMDQPTTAINLQMMNYDVNSPGAVSSSSKRNSSIVQHSDTRTFFFPMTNTPAANSGVINEIGIRPTQSTALDIVWNIEQIIFLSNESSAQFIAFNELEALDEGAPSFDLMASTSSGLPVSFVSDNEAVATIDGMTVTIVGPGVANITASQAGDASYDAASNVVRALTVNAVTGGAQTISFDPVPTWSIPAGQYVVLNATATSGLPVTYESSDPTIAMVEGNLLTVISDGTIDITASQVGDSNWDAATPIIQSLTTTPLVDLVWDFETEGDNQGWEVAGLTVIGGSAVIPVSESAGTFFSEYDTLYNSAFFQSIELTMKNPGSNPMFYRFRVDGTSDWRQIAIPDALNDTDFETHSIDLSADANYFGAIGALQLRINAGDAGTVEVGNVRLVANATSGSQSITFAALDPVSEEGPAFELMAIASSGLAVTYTSSNLAVATISGSTVTIVGKGATDITASQAGGNGWDPATPVVRTLTVLAVGSIPDIEFTFDTDEEGFEWNFGNNPITSVVQANGAITLTWDGDGSALPYYLKNLDAPFNANDYQLAEIVLKNNSAGDVQFRTRNTVDAGADRFQFHDFDQNLNDTEFQTYIFPLQGAKYDGAPIDHIQINPPADQTGTGLSIEIDNIRILAQGSTAQTITFETPAAVTIGDADFILAGTASSQLPLNYTSSDPTVATVRVGVVTVVGAGTTDITAYQYGDGTYAQAAPVVQTLTVETRVLDDQTIDFGSLSNVTFGDDSFELTASATSILTVSYASSNTTVATISGSTVTVVGAGSTNITASQAGDDFYNPAPDVVQSLVVDKADQTITFEAPVEVSEDAVPFNLAASASSGLVVTYASATASVATITGNLVTIVGPGTSVISASQAGNGDFNAAAEVSHTLTVTAIPLGNGDLIESFIVYPNPSASSLNIALNEKWKGAELTLYNLSGKKVLNIKLTEQVNGVSLEGLSPGNYILEVSNGIESETRSIIKNYRY